MSEYKTITDDEREQIFQLVRNVLKARNMVLAKGVRRPIDQLILHCGDLAAPVLTVIGYAEVQKDVSDDRPTN